jgi:hypothetical protein
MVQSIFPHEADDGKGEAGERQFRRGWAVIAADEENFEPKES